MGTKPSDLEERYKAILRNTLISARNAGAKTFLDFLRRSEGADPRKVLEIIEENELLKEHLSPKPSELSVDPRGETARLPLRMPAGDPETSQWWFSLDAADRLALRIRHAVETSPTKAAPVFLGAPTVGYRYAQQFQDAVVLDVDRHVCEALAPSEGFSCDYYDVAASLPPQLVGSSSVILLDPPWYDDALRAFLSRAIDILGVEGDIFCSLPPRLTRPSAIRERVELVTDLVNAGLDIHELDRSELEYLVPSFEERAFEGLAGFDGRPWRYGDLIHLRKTDGYRGTFSYCQIKPDETKRYARVKDEYRIFQRPSSSHDPTSGKFLTPISNYSTNVSRRAHEGVSPDLWTSEKGGFLVRSHELVEKALECWQKGISREQTISTLAENNAPGLIATELVEDLEEHLRLWNSWAVASTLTASPETGEEEPVRLFAKTEPGKREYGRASDHFRPPFARDRDRIVWSSSMRSLSNKTQLFPVERHDRLRQRLTHSLEVMQLASTIASSLGLDRDLVEAGSLAHDIGHTPFGHAGEVALDRLFARIDSGLGGFNHYEHGVDVVRWVEDAYQAPAIGGHPGLNLTPAVMECVFKHTFCHSGGVNSSTDLWEASKHKDIIPTGYCHLEGQAVRIADKISYLISDIEDGILLGILGVEELLECRLFHCPPLDIVPPAGQTLYSWFITQRRSLIETFMRDVIRSSKRRLSSIGVTNAHEVRRFDGYIIDHSDEIKNDMNVVWNRLQAGCLHKDSRVQIANMRAAKVVSDLTVLFALSPDLIDAEFRQRHKLLRSTGYLEFYRAHVGDLIKLDKELMAFLAFDFTIGGADFRGQDREIPVHDLIQAKDYTAAMTDRMAQDLHEKYIGF